MPQHDSEQKAFIEVWRILLRYRWRFVLPAFVAVAVTLAASLALPRKYQANATFERTTDMVIREMQHGGATQSYEDPARALSQQIVGDNAISQLIQKLEPKLKQMGVVHDDRDLRQLHSRIHRQTTLHREISSGQLDRLRLEYIGNDPRVAQMVANGLVQQYIDKQRKQMQERLDQSSTFFKAQVTLSQKQAKTLEDQLLNFEIKHAELLPDSPNNIQSQISDLTDQLQQLQAQRDGLASQITSLKASLANEPKMVSKQVPVENTELKRLKNRQDNLEDELNNDLEIKKMRPTHPDVIDLQHRIKTLDARIQKAAASPTMAMQTVENPKRDALTARLDQATTDCDALDQQLAAMKSELARKTKKTSNLYAIRSKYESLQRKVAEAQHQISFWQDNLRHISLSSTAESDHRGVSLKFVSRAGKVETPVSPKLPQVILAAAVMGLLTGSICVFLAYRADETFLRGDAAAKAIDLPLIGAVSEVVTHRYRRLRTIRHAILYPANALVMALILTGLMSIVYLNLQRPTLYATLRGQAASLLHLTAAPAATHH